MTAARTIARWLRQQIHNLRHALLWGPDEPPAPLRPLGKLPLIPVVVIALLVLVSGAVLLGVVLNRPTLDPARLWWLIVMGLGVLLLSIMVRRPLLAWKLACLALLYEVLLVSPGDLRVAGFRLADISPLVDWLPPLLMSPLQVVVFLLVLFVVAVSQVRGVVFWIWLSTSALVVLATVAWTPHYVEGVAAPWSQFGWASFPAGGGFEQRVDPRLFLLAGLVLVAVVVLAGQLVRGRSLTRQELAEVQERGLVLDERARLARELHDVVAHHVSMIAVRAETAPYRLGELPEPARRELAEISQASRDSLNEMRRLLGVLRSDGPPPTTPQPGLAHLAELVETTRAAGTPITLEMHGSMAGLPAAVDVSAYRILQEALTNAARHATGAPVHLTLRRTTTELSLSVRNGLRPPDVGDDHGAPPAVEGGHGLRGMRERATMLGGELHAAPTGDGGFEVSATLPLRRSEP